jgi:hypothetical protein
MALQIYTELRDNVIKAVCTSYWETGNFWEQYN